MEPKPVPTAPEKSGRAPPEPAVDAPAKSGGMIGEGGRSGGGAPDPGADEREGGMIGEG
jgi:hypothetical protein